MKYRSVLYANYHTTQSGRAALTDAQTLFNREKWQFKNEIIPLLGDLPKNAAIFDMGCGSGSLLQALKDAGFQQLMGMDVSAEQVEMAHSLGVKEIVLGDAMAYLREHPAAFQLITGMDIIEHFTKDELVELLQLIQSALKPGGRAIFRTPNMDAPMATVFSQGDFTHENYLNASSAQQVMLACGYPQVEVKPSHMQIASPWKELLRKILYSAVELRTKITLFATARSSRNIVFTPNMIIIGKK